MNEETLRKSYEVARSVLQYTEHFSFRVDDYWMEVTFSYMDDAKLVYENLVSEYNCDVHSSNNFAVRFYFGDC